MHPATRRSPLAALAGTFLLSAVHAAAQPSTYAVEFVSTASGSALNAQGMAAGVRFRLQPGAPVDVPRSP
jgi:hypothetical protein